MPLITFRMPLGAAVNFGKDAISWMKINRPSSIRYSIRMETLFDNILLFENGRAD